MKKIFFIALSLFVIGLSFTQAQVRTKGTDLLIVVNNESNTVTDIEIMNGESANYTLFLKKYPNAKFYKGKISGKFKASGNVVTPLSRSTVTIYTHEQFVKGDRFVSAENYIPGNKISISDPFNLAGVMSRISLLNGIFVLKVL